MTCVVGIKHNKKVYLAGDAAGTSGDGTKIVVGEPKVFTVGNFLIGFAQSFRAAQIIEHFFEPPEVDKDAEKDLINYLVVDFLPTLQETLAEHGVMSVLDPEGGDGEHQAPIALLIAYKHRLFEMQVNYHIYEVPEYSAIGAGRDLALGSLFSTKGVYPTPEERLTVALEAAAKFNATVAKPFTIVHT